MQHTKRGDRYLQVLLLLGFAKFDERHHVQVLHRLLHDAVKQSAYKVMVINRYNLRLTRKTWSSVCTSSATSWDWQITRLSANVSPDCVERTSRTWA